MRARWVLIAALVAALCLPSVAAAQFGPVGPAGQIFTVLDELTVSNIASATATSILPPSGTSYLASVSNCAGVVCVMEIDGEMWSAQASPGTFTILASIGYVPTLTAVSARTLEASLAGVPFNLKCKRSPDATVGAAPRGGAMYCTFRYIPTSTTEVVFNSSGQGLLPTGPPIGGGALGVIATISYSSGQKGNGVIIRSFRFGQGT